MSASFLPALSAAPAAAPAVDSGSGPRDPSSAPSTDDGQDFGTHLHDARQQQTQADDGGASASAPAKAAPSATAADGAKSADGESDRHRHKASDDGAGQDGSDTGLAAAVLGQIGQAVPPAVVTSGAAAGADGSELPAAVGTSAAIGATAVAAALPTMAAPTGVQAAAQPKTLPGSDPGATASGKPGIVDLDAKLADQDGDGDTDTDTDDADAGKAGDQPAQAAAAAVAGAQADTAATRGLGAATVAGAPAAFAAPAAKSHTADLASTAAGALAAGPAQPAPAPGAPHVLDIGAPAGTPGFAQELGEQIAWLGGQDVKQANIRLHPAELGQLDVKVSLSHGRVDVAFSAQHPAAVAAVQQTLGQLDLMLAGHGLSLGQTQVGQQGGDGAPRGQSSSGTGGESGDDGETLLGTTPISQQRPVGLLDAFA